jgi:DNA invertase Pin-like site-specific DNA recombinase
MTKRAILWLAVSTTAQAEDEKASLPKQREEAVAVCNKNGWTVIDVLEVPGHSRRYTDIYKCATDMETQGIDAFSKLLRHWENADFDVLVVRDGSRFARTQALHARIVEDTIAMGAEIYSLMDGQITETNYRMWISMGGYSAAVEIDNLVKRRDMGFDARVKRGLPANHSVPISHKIVRDASSGKAVRVELNEETTRMWDDLAHLLIEGLPWRHIEQEMFNRFGHANPLGEPYQHNFYHRIVFTPAFWGHTARHFKNSGRGTWVFEEGEPAPEGVSILYNMHPAVWTGDLAEKVKAELRRREESIRGKAKSFRTKMFTGLFICAECGYNLSYGKKADWASWKCMSRYEQSATRPDCSERKHISEKKAKAYIDNRLRQMIENGNPTSFLPSHKNETQSNKKQLKEIQTELENIDKQIRRMIMKQADTDDISLQSMYDDEIKTAMERLRILQGRERELMQEAAQNNIASQQRAFEEIAEMTVEKFWEQDSTKINQLLHRLMGKSRFVVQAGVVVGIANVPKRKKRYN